MSEPRRLRKGEGYGACDAAGARALLLGTDKSAFALLSRK